MTSRSSAAQASWTSRNAATAGNDLVFSKRRKIFETSTVEGEDPRSTAGASTTTPLVSPKPWQRSSNIGASSALNTTDPQFSSRSVNLSVDKSIEDEIDEWWESVINESASVPSGATPSHTQTPKKFNLRREVTDKPSGSIANSPTVASPFYKPALSGSPAVRSSGPVSSRPTPAKSPTVRIPQQNAVIALDVDDDDDFEAPDSFSAVPKPAAVSPIAKKSVGSPLNKTRSPSLSSMQRNSRRGSIGVIAIEGEDGWIERRTAFDSVSDTTPRKRRADPNAIEEGVADRKIEEQITAFKSKFPQQKTPTVSDQFSEESISGWSSEQLLAWQNRNEDPETFYSFFCELGTPNHRGDWQIHEVRQFFVRLAEFERFHWRLCWGCFSTAIPNRTGAQCCSFFQMLKNYKIVSESSGVSCLDSPPSGEYSLSAPNDTLVRQLDQRVQRIWPSEEKDGDEDEDAVLIESESDREPEPKPSAADPMIIDVTPPLSFKSSSTEKPVGIQKVDGRPSPMKQQKHNVQRTLGFYISGIKNTPNVVPLSAVDIPYEIVGIPKQIPANMCRIVAPFAMASKTVAGSFYHSCCLENIPWSKIEAKGPFQAVLMDPPWNELTCARLMEYVKISSALIPSGFIFMWCEKQYIAKALKVMKRWKFEYVENMVWVQLHANSRISTQYYPSFNTSKLTLLICRKGKGEELRHQRNPDVWFEAPAELKFDEGGARFRKPEFAYHLIETLLPTANYSERSKKGAFLELWCARDYHRQGWTSCHIEPVEHQTAEMSQQQASQIDIVEELLSSTQLAPIDQPNNAFADEEEEILFAEDSESEDASAGRPLVAPHVAPDSPAAAVPDSPPCNLDDTFRNLQFESEIWLD